MCDMTNRYILWLICIYIYTFIHDTMYRYIKYFECHTFNTVVIRYVV